MKVSSPMKRRCMLAAGLIAVFTVTGFFILPPIIKSQLEKRLSSELGRRVTVGKVRLNPYALSLALENFAIQERDGTTQFLGWRRLYVNFNPLSSLSGDWVLGKVSLDGFSMRGQVNPDQSLNVSDLIAKFAPPAGSAAPPGPPAKPGRPIRINLLQVTDARISLTDLSRKQPFATTLGPLNFDLTGFRTVPDRDAPYHFEAVTEAGERLVWSGTLRAEPFQSAGELSLENIVLAKYAPYYSDRTQADIVAGKLSVRGRYEIDLTEARRALRLSDGSLQLRGLELRERAATQDAVELPALDVAGVEADALTQKATVASIALSGGHIRVRRDKDGSINLLAMLQPPQAGAAPKPAASPAAAAKPPDVSIGELALKDFQVDVTDLAAPRPAQLSLSSLQFSLKNVTLAEGAQMPLHLAFGWAPAGSVAIDGSVAIAPVKASLKIAVTGLEFLPLSPYLEQFVNARITGGAVTATLDTQVSMPPRKPPAAAVAGDVTIEKLGLVDGARNEDLAGFSALTLRGLRAGTAPEPGMALDEIDLAGPYARIVVNSDKTVNLALVAKPGTGAPVAAPAIGAPPPALPKIEIGRIVISDGNYSFTDHSLDPNVTMAIDHFGGTIGGLSSTNPAKADVDLKALVDGDGPVSITGKLDPLGANKLVDLKIALKNVDLLPLSPYSGKFAGYELARGKLELDLKFLLDGKKIDASNVLTLNQFTFGDPVRSPDATGLPVRLGVALLKDTDGNIVIDMPIQGTVDDPNFRIGRVVLRVVVNLLTKAAVSPFSLLGAAFGGGGDELGYQEFAPGSAEIQPAEVGKLQTMTRAMANRPGLSLGIEGSYDTAADAYALKRLKLDDQVRRAIWETKHLANPDIPPPGQLVITQAEKAAEIKKLFDAKFPPGTQFGTPLPPPPAVVAPPPAPAGFFKRLVRAITFKAVREKRAARRENERLKAEHTQAVAAAAAAGLPVEEMSGRLAEAITIDDNDLRKLAQERAQTVRDYFANVGKIGPDRLFLAHASAAAGAVKAGKGPRVFLELQ